MEQLHSCINIIEAERTLIGMKVSDYPNLKQKDREKFHRSMMDLANPTKKYKSIKDVIKQFNGG